MLKAYCFIKRCFRPGGARQTSGQCVKIDFPAGNTEPRPVKGVGICDTLPPLEDCVLKTMIQLAKTIGKRVGAYIRVDMFVGVEGTVYVQEVCYEKEN